MDLEQWREPAAAIAEGVRLFNAGAFFETHEVLEISWRGASEPMKSFLKGFIHAAVAFYQYDRRNAYGVGSKYRSTHYYLDPYRPEFGGIDVAGLLAGIDQFFTPLPEGPEGPWHPAEWPRPMVRCVPTPSAGGLEVRAAGHTL